MNRFFVLSFEDETQRTNSKRYDCWKNFLNQPVRNNLITYNSIRKIATGQRDD